MEWIGVERERERERVRGGQGERKIDVCIVERLKHIITHTHTHTFNSHFL